MSKIFKICSAAILCWTLQAQAEPVDLGHAKELIDSGKSAEAYALLSPYESEHSGEPDYDYLLGVAALDSGQPDKAIIIFDRVLAANPQFAGARLDMGRAYFALGSLEQARKEFETVQGENPPEGAKAVIEKYLAAIDERNKPKVNTLTAYVEGIFGHDSNVNASTSESLVNVPALGIPVTLSSNNLEKSSYYLGTNAGGEFTRLVKPGFSLFVGADLKYRDTPDATIFNTGEVNAHLGLKLGQDADSYTMSLQKDRFYLGGDPNRDTTGAIVQWQHTLNPQNQFSLFGMENWIRYAPQSLKPENIDQTIIGGNWVYALDPEARTILSPTLFLGHETQDNIRANGDKNLIGAKLAGQHILRDKLAVFGNLGYQYGQYLGENIAFLTHRLDHQYDAAAGLNWQFADSWFLRPQLAYTRNNTTIPIYKYDRTDISVAVRWDFR